MDDAAEPPVTAELRTYLDSSPSPFHACHTAAELLRTSGFDQATASEPLPDIGFVIRDGALYAWRLAANARGFRVVAAHTDSPTLRVKPRPDIRRAGQQLLGFDIYGGPLLSTWTDRDLGLAGRVSVRDGAGFRVELLRSPEPFIRVSQLAIHFNRTVNTDGLKLDPQKHLAAHFAGRFVEYVAAQLDCSPDDVLGWDVMTFDPTPARLLSGGLLASGRMDNLVSAFAAVRALSDSPATDFHQVIVLFDHEEVGSTTERGANSVMLPTLLQRLAGDRYPMLVSDSVIASADMAHATHPNYPEYHEPHHHIALDGGPVLKVNHQMRYATDAVGTAVFSLACQQAQVPMQVFDMRADLPCGSTVGPFVASTTGMTTVDVGAAMLSMHSAREVCGVRDPQMYVAALAAFLAPVG